MINHYILPVVVFFLFCGPLNADTIYFNDGTSIEGKIIKETEITVTIKQVVNPAVTKTIECAKSKIDRIEKPMPKKPEPAPVAIKQPVAEGKPKKTIPVSTSKVAELPRRQPKPNALSQAYKLIKCQDKSFIGSMNMKRLECSVVVSNLLPDLALLEIFSSVLEEQRSAVNSLDALWVIVYNEGAGVDGLPRAYGIWSPPGGWDDFSNIRDKTRYLWDYRFLDR